jgi:hypothetical protein
MKPRLTNKSAIQSFFKQAPPVKSPAPKFQIGDYIINTKFKVISKIIGMRGDFENEDRTVNYDMCEYILTDIKNDSRDSFMAQVNVRNGSGNSALQHTVQREYKRYKRVHAIDPYYNKINPEVAHALYGNKANGENK